MRRRLAPLALVPILVLLWAVRADAHASFVDAPAGIPTNSDQALTMNVPHERDDSTWNVDVQIAMPEGWSTVACEQKPTWTCELTTVGGRPVVHFVKAAGAAPAEDETFRFTVHTGNEVGTFPVPVVQTYSTGEVVRWIGAAGTDDPAPVLTTIAGGTTAPPTVPTTPPTHAPTVPPTTTATAPTTAAPTIAPTTTAPASTTTTPSSTTSTTTSTTTTTTLAPEPQDDDGDGGGSAAPWIIGAVVVVAAAAGGGAYWWKRQQGGPPAPEDV